MRKDTAVNIRIGANSSDFQKGMAAAKAAAKALQQDLQAIKAPPLPDIGKIMGLQKKQVFNPFGSEWKAGLQKGTADLKAELERQAQAYREANRKLAPEMKRMALSSLPNPLDHLQGTQFQGGTRGTGGGRSGAGAGRGYALGVGYNAVQDLVQGGPMAIANNVPQIIDLVAKSPALKVLGAAGFAAASVFFAYKTYKDFVGAEDSYANRAAVNQANSRKRARGMEWEKDSAAAAAAGSAAGQAMQDADGQAAADFGTQTRRAGFAEAEKERLRALRLLRIQAIEDPAARAKAIHDEEMKALWERQETEKQMAKEAREWASDQFDIARRREGEIQKQLAAMKGQSLRPEEALLKLQLEAELPGVSATATNAKARRDAADTALRDLGASGGSYAVEGQILEEQQRQTQRKLAQERMEAERAFNEEYLRGVRQRKEAERAVAEAMARQSKARAQIEREVQIAELQNSSPRKAEKLRKEQALEDRTKQIQSEGNYSEADARKIATREQRAADRAANPRRIRGAGAGQRDERPSGLDYFDGKRMGTPETSALDEYEKRRSMPGVGKKVDQDMAEKEAAAAKAAAAGQAPKATGDTTSHSLLKQLIDAVTSLGGKLAAPLPTPAPAAT